MITSYRVEWPRNDGGRAHIRKFLSAELAEHFARRQSKTVDNVELKQFVGRCKTGTIYFAEGKATGFDAPKDKEFVRSHMMGVTIRKANK